MKPRPLPVLARTLRVAAVLAIALVTPASAVVPEVSWAFGPTAPFSLTRFDGERVGSRIYFLGGRTFVAGIDVTVGNVLFLDLSTRQYGSAGVSMPIPISNYGIALLQDSTGLGLYVFGGRDANANIIDAVQVYYPATNTGTVVASDPYPGQTPTGCIPLPAMGAAVLGNKAYVLGGSSFASTGCVDDNTTEVWIFDPMAAAGARWTQGPSLSQARGYITPAVIGSTLYAIGGDVNSAGTLFAQTIVETLDTSDPAATWQRVADLPTPCDESQAFGFSAGPLANQIVLAGCGQWPEAVPASLMYDGTSNTWAPTGTILENRRNHAGALIPVGASAQMFILGGYGEASGFIEPIDTSEHSVAASAPRARRQTPSAEAARDIPVN